MGAYAGTPVWWRTYNTVLDLGGSERQAVHAAINATKGMLIAKHYPLRTGRGAYVRTQVVCMGRYQKVVKFKLGNGRVGFDSVGWL